MSCVLYASQSSSAKQRRSVLPVINMSTVAVRVDGLRKDKTSQLDTHDPYGSAAHTINVRGWRWLIRLITGSTIACWCSMVWVRLWDNGIILCVLRGSHNLLAYSLFSVTLQIGLSGFSKSVKG